MSDSLRDTIRKALGDKWTKELEESLFWPLAEFCQHSAEINYKNGREHELSDLRKAGIIK